jgi:hypothetical protein
MKRSVVIACAAGVFALGTASTAAGFGGPNPNPNAQDNCSKVIDSQSENGIAAGGGPKADILAPTNCDHFFQDVGAIGNGLPPSLP